MKSKTQTGLQLVKVETKDPIGWITQVTKQTDKVFTALEKVKKIKTMDDFNLAAGYVKFLKNTVKLAKTKQNKKPDPYAEFFKRVTKADKDIKVLIKEFLANNRNKVNQLDEDVASGKIKNIGKYVSKVSALSIDSEYASTRKTWKAVIVDEGKIPRQWMTPDAAKITEHLRKGGNPISGVSWEQIEGVAI